MSSNVGKRALVYIFVINLSTGMWKATFSADCLLDDIYYENACAVTKPKRISLLLIIRFGRGKRYLVFKVKNSFTKTNNNEKVRR